MSGRLGGGRSLFDEFFSDFFDRSPGGGGRTGRPQAPARRAESVDVTQFFSDATRQLLQRAAQTALEWGSLDLESDHLLFGALQDDVARHVLEQLGADPGAVAAQLEEEAEKGERTDVAPSLAPDAKAALLAAYEESRELGVTYVGPEHVLLALARDEESPAGQLLQRFGLSHTKLRGAVIRGVEAGAPREQSKTPRLEEFGRDLTQEAREGKLDPVIGRAEEIEQTIEILSRRTKNNPAPGSHGDAERDDLRPVSTEPSAAGRSSSSGQIWARGVWRRRRLRDLPPIKARREALATRPR